jgi:hypothetical protein
MSAAFSVKIDGQLVEIDEKDIWTKPSVNKPIIKHDGVRRLMVKAGIKVESLEVIITPTETNGMRTAFLATGSNADGRRAFAVGEADAANLQPNSVAAKFPTVMATSADGWSDSPRTGHSWSTPPLPHRRRRTTCLVSPAPTPTSRLLVGASPLEHGGDQEHDWQPQAHGGTGQGGGSLPRDTLSREQHPGHGGRHWSHDGPCVPPMPPEQRHYRHQGQWEGHSGQADPEPQSDPPGKRNHHRHISGRER